MVRLHPRQLPEVAGSNPASHFSGTVVQSGRTPAEAAGPDCSSVVDKERDIDHSRSSTDRARPSEGQDGGSSPPANMGNDDEDNDHTMRDL